MSTPPWVSLHSSSDVGLPPRGDIAVHLLGDSSLATSRTPTNSEQFTPPSPTGTGLCMQFIDFLPHSRSTTLTVSPNLLGMGLCVTGSDNRSLSSSFTARHCVKRIRASARFSCLLREAWGEGSWKSRQTDSQLEWTREAAPTVLFFSELDRHVCTDKFQV
jgi:hypothetical protein